MVAGLGNMGAQYANTKHNIGLIGLKALAQSYNAPFKTKLALGGHIAETSKGLLLYWPETYMNIAGKNVKMALSKSKVNHRQLIVLHDCLETKLGKVKVTKTNSFKGHNGLKSISSEYGGTKDFYRIAIGIGRPEERDQ